MNARVMQIAARIAARGAARAAERLAQALRDDVGHGRDDHRGDGAVIRDGTTVQLRGRNLRQSAAWRWPAGLLR